MTEIDRAYALLQPGESAVVIFTRGTRLATYADGTGSTGYWKVGPNLAVDRVIIYLRQADGANAVYTALPDALLGPNDDGRYGISLKQMAHVGWTKASWHQFAATQANPIRYLTRA